MPPRVADVFLVWGETARRCGLGHVLLIRPAYADLRWFSGLPRRHRCLGGCGFAARTGACGERVGEHESRWLTGVEPDQRYVGDVLRDNGVEDLPVEVADVTDSTALVSAVERAEQEFGAVDVLINNAGVGGPAGPMWEVDEDAWWQAMEVNVRGTLRACRAAVRGMVERGHGRVVNIVSSAGKHRWPNVSGYSVSKAATIKLGENLAPELEGTGVSVLNYHPGLVDLGLTRKQLEAGETGDSRFEGVGAWMADQRDGGRLTDPEESARLLVRLVFGEADALSGSYLTPEDDLNRLLGG